MAVIEQVNVGPHFTETQLPCDGMVGDLLVLSPLKEGERDPSPQGLATVWVCIKSAPGAERDAAVWARVQFDGVASCGRPVPAPPQGRPDLVRG